MFQPHIQGFERFRSPDFTNKAQWSNIVLSKTFYLPPNHVPFRSLETRIWSILLIITTHWNTVNITQINMLLLINI